MVSELSKEVIDVCVSNGLNEPYLMGIVDRLICGLSKDEGDIVLTFGFSEGKEFVSIDIGYLQNIFEVDYPNLNYFLMSSDSGFYDMVLTRDISDGGYRELMDKIFVYLDLQFDLLHLGDGKISLRDFDERLKRL